MSEEGGKTEQVETLLATPDLASALESEQFRRFLDQIPIAIVVAEMKGSERIVYANPEFEKLSGQIASGMVGKPWSAVQGRNAADSGTSELGAAIIESSDFVGTFKIDRAEQDTVLVDAYSNVIEDDSGKPCYRLAALVDVGAHGQQREEFERAIRERDTLLWKFSTVSRTTCR